MKVIFCLCSLILTANILFAQKKTDTVVIPSSSNNSQMRFHTTDAGKILVLNLAENRTTGYMWVASETSAGILSLVKDEYIQKNNKSANGVRMMGVGGTRKFIYQLTGTAGTEKLEFAKKAPGGEMTSEKFSYSIIVADPVNNSADTIIINGSPDNQKNEF